MTNTLKATAAIALTAFAMAGTPALAKGGGSDAAEQRAKLKAELAEARSASEADSSPSIFERLFGSDDAMAQTDGTSKN